MLQKIFLSFYVFLFFGCAGDTSRKELSGPHAGIYLLINNTSGIDGNPIFELKASQSLNGFYSELFTTDSLLTEAIKKTGIPGKPADIRNQLRFSTVENTELLIIEFFFPAKKMAVEFLRNLVMICEENIMEYQGQSVRNELTKLREAMDLLRIKIDSLEKGIEPLMENFNAEESAALFHDLLDLEMREKEFRQVQNYVEDDDMKPVILEVNTADDFLTHALNELYNLRLQVKQLKPSSSGSEITKLEEKINIRKSDLQTYLQNSMKAIEAKKIELNARIKAIPEPKAKHILDLDRDEKLYTYMIESIIEKEIRMAGITRSIKIVEGPVWKEK